MRPSWMVHLRKYAKPGAGKSIFQLTTTLLSYFALLILMYFIITNYSYFWTIPLIVVAAGLLVRIFIIFHDCVHRSFFRSKRLCSITGSFLGILVFTSFYDWRRTHLIHHGSFGNLNKRGVGDVWTMTVREYLNASRSEKMAYRIYRNPLFLFGPGSIFLFLIWNRFPVRGAGAKEILSVIFTNVALLAITGLAWSTFGIQEYLMIQLPVIGLAGIFGTWLFYIQHQFDEVRWWNGEEWNKYGASMEGSSFYDLPAILRWFSGNIGYHHIHHLSPRIPNYNLKSCHDENLELQDVKPVTLLRSFRFSLLQLWDEEREELVGVKNILKYRSV